MSDKNLHSIADFLFEVGMLAKTPRSGFFFLGSGEQSVAEHLNRVTYIGFVLAQMTENVDESKVIKMCMFHDLSEARISDLNYVHQKYTTRLETEATNDLAATLPFGNKITEILNEYSAKQSTEAMLAKDADNLEFLLSLKEQKDNGNERATIWIANTLKRLKTPAGIELGETIVHADSDHWWFGDDKENNWWVHRNKN
jgi:putative hydrolase of HD superfamily